MEEAGGSPRVIEQLIGKIDKCVRQRDEPGIHIRYYGFMDGLALCFTQIMILRDTGGTVLIQDARLLLSTLAARETE